MTAHISRRAALRAAGLLVALGSLPQSSPAAAEPSAPGTPGAPDAQRPADSGAEELAHYYRFLEITEGRRMVRSPDGTWSFNGPPVPFDPDGVHPVVDNPDTASLPAGSPQRAASEECDLAYTHMLHALNRVFDGHPDELHEATAAMFALESRARRLMTVPSAPGAPTVLGPAFSLVQPVPPAT